jgi:hypothetical protein
LAAQPAALTVAVSLTGAVVMDFAPLDMLKSWCDFIRSSYPIFY